MSQRKAPDKTALVEAAVGLWSQEKASLRPLEEWERPALGDVADDRMVVYAEGAGTSLLTPRWTGIYAPLRSPRLLPDFMRVFGRTRRPRNSQIVRFYGQYGPLHLSVSPPRKVPFWAERLTQENQGKLSREAKRGLCEPVWWLVRHARELVRAYSLYVALKNDDVGTLRELLPAVGPGEQLIRYEWREGEITPYLRDHPSSADGHLGDGGAAMGPLSDEQCREWGRTLLADRLSQGDRDSRPGWHVLEKEIADELGPEQTTGVPRLVRGRTFTSLLGAMYTQLGRLVIAGEELRVCEGCGGWYYSTHGRQKHCEPYCADAARQREARRAAKGR
jgi:hypothetical protein